MSFRIHSQSPELKRELEDKLADLAGQFEEGYEYEISAAMLPREQALERVEDLAKEIGAEAVFIAEGVFAVEAPQEEDPDFAMGLPPVSEPQPAAENVPTTEAPAVPEPAPVHETRAPRIDTQKLRDSVNAAASRARDTVQRAGEKTGDALKVAGERAGHFMRDAGAWAARKTREAKTVGVELRSRLAAKSIEWKENSAQRNAQRKERARMEAEARAERQRAAHREAELAAISAQVMLERQKQEETSVEAPEPVRRKPETKPVLRPAAPMKEERDMWPVWRNAFVAAACIALIGVFLLATGSKQSNAVPPTSTELSQPVVVVPAHVVERPKPQAVAPQPAVQIPQKVVAKPSARKHVVSSEDEDDAFREVTVRHYPNASPLAPPKKNSKGVVQISDME